MPHSHLPSTDTVPAPCAKAHTFRRRFRFPEKPADAASPPNAVGHTFRRTQGLRCVALTLFAMAAGYLILQLCLPAMGRRTADLAARHFAVGTPPITAWLRLLAARLPFLGLLAVAGLTRISGGLCTSILVWRGICDGGALCAVIALVRGEIAFAYEGLPLWVLLTVYLAWMLSNAALRIAVALSSRKLATYCSAIGDATLSDGNTRAALRYFLWRHATVAAGAVCLCMIHCLFYVILIL